MSPSERPLVVCLCGSTRFKDEFIRENARLTGEGKIVLSVGFFLHADNEPLDPNTKVALDELHKRKIDLADEVFVINVGGYIGESTRSEIAYAEVHGKLVTYLEPKCVPHLGCATTRQLLQEVKARGEVSYAGDLPATAMHMLVVAGDLLDTLPQSMLDYRTVDS